MQYIATAHADGADGRKRKALASKELGQRAGRGEASRRALVVEDDLSTQRSLAAMLMQHGFGVSCAGSLREMMEHLARDSFDAVFLDIQLSDGNSLDALPEVTMRYPSLRVLVMTSSGSIDFVVRSIMQGACDFLEKPLDANVVGQKLAAMFRGGDTDARRIAAGDIRMAGIIGASPAMRRVSDQIWKMKDADATVLITGESGTGKEVVARALHSLSHRGTRPFSAVNCAAIPESLLEAELFGSRKGAYTDAKIDRKGLFEVCSEGTLFLDEVAEMPPPMQAKLLRVLQEKEVTPLGSTQSIKINTRVIAASNRRLDDLVAQGGFREDLFYRLSVLQIYIPPLRQRKEDIPLLARHFIETISKRMTKRIEPPTQEIMARLVNYQWPGNVRELQNALERAIVLSDGGVLMIDDIFGGSRNQKEVEAGADQLGDFNYPLAFGDLKTAKDRFEEFYLRELLKATRGNIAQASRIAGRARTDMYRLFTKYDLDLSQFKGGHAHRFDLFSGGH